MTCSWANFDGLTKKKTEMPSLVNTGCCAIFFHQRLSLSVETSVNTIIKVTSARLCKHICFVQMDLRLNVVSDVALTVDDRVISFKVGVHVSSNKRLAMKTQFDLFFWFCYWCTNKKDNDRPTKH